jgi:hypothetical protein
MYPQILLYNTQLVKSQAAYPEAFLIRSDDMDSTATRRHPHGASAGRPLTEKPNPCYEWVMTPAFAFLAALLIRGVD